MGQVTTAWGFPQRIGTMIRRFWAAVPGSLKDHLNTEELLRITITSITAGGGLFGLVEALSNQAGTVFPASADAGLATAVLTMILEARRRLGQGQEPPPGSVRSFRDRGR